MTPQEATQFLRSRNAHEDVTHMHPAFLVKFAEAVRLAEAKTGRPANIKDLNTDQELQGFLRTTLAPHFEPKTAPPVDAAPALTPASLTAPPAVTSPASLTPAALAPPSAVQPGVISGGQGSDTLIGGVRSGLPGPVPWTVAQMEAMVRKHAVRHGIDPDVAVAVARAEGLKPDTWQGRSKLAYGRERSYGPLQLHDPPKGYGEGVGSRFHRETGLDPADPRNVEATIDYGLGEVRRAGWGQWYGAADAGIGNWQGVNRNAPVVRSDYKALYGGNDRLASSTERVENVPPVRKVELVPPEPYERSVVDDFGRKRFPPRPRELQPNPTLRGPFDNPVNTEAGRTREVIDLPIQPNPTIYNPTDSPVTNELGQTRPADGPVIVPAGGSPGGEEAPGPRSPPSPWMPGANPLGNAAIDEASLGVTNMPGYQAQLAQMRRAPKITMPSMPSLAGVPGGGGKSAGAGGK